MQQAVGIFNGVPTDELAKTIDGPLGESRVTGKAEGFLIPSRKVFETMELPAVGPDLISVCHDRRMNNHHHHSISRLPPSGSLYCLN